MNDHLIRLAERFGLSHKESSISRRAFLKGMVATGALFATPSGLLMPREPKIYRVSGVVAPEFVDGRAHVRLPDGREITIRDFREEDKWDTVVFPLRDAEFKFSGSIADFDPATGEPLFKVATREVKSKFVHLSEAMTRDYSIARSRREDAEPL
jgi:hypothetical protein